MVPLGVALASLRRRSLAPGLHPDGEPAALQVTGVGRPATLTAPPPPPPVAALLRACWAQPAVSWPPVVGPPPSSAPRWPHHCLVS